MWVLVQVAGGLLVVLVGADVFYTVLFPGSGHGPLRRPLTRWVWHGFRLVAVRLGKERQRELLAYSGPVMIALSIGLWAAVMVVGWALVYLPALGHSITASSGPTSRSFATAFYYSGFSLTTLGTGDVVAHTGLYRWLTVTEAVVGFATVSLVITYFMSVYSALTQRRTFGAVLDHRTGGAGDSVRLAVAQSYAAGDSAGTGQLSSIGEFLQRVCETHRAYPVLRYFHFRHVRYALPRMLLLGLDSAALLATVLDPDHYRRALRVPALTVVARAGDELLGELVPTAGGGDGAVRPDAWREHYLAAVQGLAEAGVRVRTDLEAGLQEYAERRAGWDGALRQLAAAMLYDWSEIDPCGGTP